MLRILAPVDGSPSSNDAVAYLAHSLKELGPAEVHILHVQPPVHEKIAAIAKPGLLERYRADEARDATAVAERLLKQAGIRHAVIIETGEPAETIALYSRSRQCDESVMGTRGMGAIKGAVLGSVAMKVLHCADTPVKLVKHAVAAKVAKVAA